MRQADDRHAGHTPRLRVDGLTLADMRNRFLTTKVRKQEVGEHGRQTFYARSEPFATPTNV